MSTSRQYHLARFAWLFKYDTCNFLGSCFLLNSKLTNYAQLDDHYANPLKLTHILVCKLLLICKRKEKREKTLFIILYVKKK